MGGASKGKFSSVFRQELLGAVVERVGLSHYGWDRHESGEEKAKRLVAEELTRLGWEEKELSRQRRRCWTCAPSIRVQP